MDILRKIFLNIAVSIAFAIMANMLLCMPAAAKKADVINYKIRSGDTLNKISKKYGVSLDAIIRKNNISNKNIIQIGDVIIIPKAIKVKLYFIKEFETGIYLVSEARSAFLYENKYVTAVKELIKGSADKKAFMPIHGSTKVLEVKLEKGILYVNLTKDIYKSNVGSLTEALTLDAIADTLTEFPEVKGVMLLVNGKAIGSMGGHVEVDRPLTRNLEVVRKGK